MDKNNKTRTHFPDKGRPANEVLGELTELKAGDADWQHGRVPLFVFKGSDAVTDLGQQAFSAYFSENALGAARAFPSVARMERDVIGMALDLFHAPQGARGFMTSGGSESIVLAVRACRNHARTVRDDPNHRGNIVAPDTIHPAFDKAASLMDLTIRRAPAGTDFRADPGALAPLIDDDTIMLVGSAPCFPFGVIDPIAALAELARERRLWLHVDACVGGYLAPFVKANGHDIPDFDFAIEGVNSISADLHKYGFCPKPASTVLYRNAALAEHQPFDFDAWPSGRFVTPTIVGTRPAGGVAAAWAILQHLGREGYQQIARDLMAGVASYRQGVRDIDGLQILGDPHLAITAFAAPSMNIFAVSDRLQARGWLPGLVRRPPAIHRMMSMFHVAALSDYLADLAEAVRQEKASPTAPASADVRY
ncbi:MAG: aspartate aminotransferase family protein [Burkholderiaceae bacterium]